MKNLAGKEVEEENLDKGEGQRWPTRDFFMMRQKSTSLILQTFRFCKGIFVISVFLFFFGFPFLKSV